jgi:hypothetical protein
MTTLAELIRELGMKEGADKERARIVKVLEGRKTELQKSIDTFTKNGMHEDALTAWACRNLTEDLLIRITSKQQET